MNLNQRIERWLTSRKDSHQSPTRPLVTLAYAQSWDGSITTRCGEALPLSGTESTRLTHQLRSLHDGILVGIGTVLSDDPELTVREVAGNHPKPIVFDSHLRTPATARLLRTPPAAWILCGPQAPSERRQNLIQAGARVFEVEQQESGGLDGNHAMQLLRDEGIGRLMVEGGARVISYFLQLGLADLLVLTIAPSFLGGLPAIAGANGASSLPSLTNPHWLQLGQDMVLWGQLQRQIQ